MTNAVACFRSGETRTSVTVMLRSCSAGSRNAPRWRSRARACRISSPTRSWRCEPPGARDEATERRFLTVIGDLVPRLHEARARPAGSQRACDLFDLEALDNVALLDVVVVF